jgi:hypothetical protein
MTLNYTDQQRIRDLLHTLDTLRYDLQFAGAAKHKSVDDEPHEPLYGARCYTYADTVERAAEWLETLLDMAERAV